MGLKELIQEMREIKSLNSDYEHALARSFRMILLNNNMTPEKWDVLMDEYLDKCGLIEEKDRTTARENLTKELCGSKLTWKIFCKGLAFLGVQTVSMHIVGRSEAPDNKWIGASGVQFTPNVT